MSKRFVPKVVGGLLLALALFDGVPAGAAGPEPAAAPAECDGKLNLNVANVQQLTDLPGIGPSKALNIVAYRTKRPFRTVRQLLRVRGIGPALYRRLEPLVAVCAPAGSRPPTMARGFPPQGR